MATDIHIHFEALDEHDEWQLVIPTVGQMTEGLMTDHWDVDSIAIRLAWRYHKDGTPRYEDGVPLPLSWWEHRNYRLFWLLSGIRGYDDGPRTRPVLHPGLPPDMAKLTAYYADCWSMDSHGHGHAMLKDLHNERLVDVAPWWGIALRQWDGVVGNRLERGRIVVWYDN